MQEIDIYPSRFSAAQDAAISYVRERRRSGVRARIGLVSFGKIAIANCGLTSTDESDAIEARIRKLSIIDGTSITAGLLSAESLFKNSPCPGAIREVRLLTDGTHNVGPEPHEVAERLKAAGCIIYALGIGGTPSAVDETLLKKVCSRNKKGQPLYEFIADRQGLMRYFCEAGGLTR
jgi:Mg-chelatase subunit ChlD